jgi:hypothetical protein
MHPRLMGSGAITIGSAGRVANKINPRIPQLQEEKTIYIFLAYTQRISAIALGATPIGSTGRAPNDNG